MNRLIRFSLEHRLLIVALAIVTLLGGGYLSLSLPVDIFPSLTRPRVTIMTEAPGLSPEEVETLVTFPLETTLNGATGVEAVRSASGIGLSVIYVEFGWNTNVYTARQIVNERLAVVANQLPANAKPQLTPISSIMGQIMMIGMWSKDGSTKPMDVRTAADWIVRQRLLTIPGVAQVIVMGGGRKQFQVQVDPDLLIAYGVTLQEVEQALGESNQNATGGYLERASMEFLVRGIGRAQSAADVGMTVVKSGARPVLIRDIAAVVEGPQIKRGDSSVNGEPAVVLTVAKQPEADTRRLTEDVEKAVREIQASLAKTNPDLVLDANLYQQRTFIDIGIHNVVEALRDGAILVTIILFLFLMNFRTTVITLTAIPLSLVLTGLFFYLTGMSINVMTLGGLAVAMGELVDDAIVDIENVFRRLKQNVHLSSPRPALTVIYEASLEIRSSIVFGTMLVILVFVPLFALQGIEGRLFTPLGIAYIVSILASLLVSLTVTPVLASLLLTPKSLAGAEHDSWLLAGLKRLVTPVIRLSCSATGNAVLLTGVLLAIIGSGFLVTRLGSDFLPPFDEGAAQVNVVLPPGSSLEQSNRVSRMVDTAFRKHMQDDKHPNGLVKSFVRRSGRAELDEHAEGVNVTEYVLTFNPESGVKRQDALATLRAELEEIPGIEYEAEQPLAHLISHMLSGVTAQIAIKIYGDDLDVLREKAQEVKAAITGIPGLAPPVVEPQQLIPQIRIELNREQLAQYGVTPGYVNEFIETALNGRVISTLLEGQRTFDLVVRLDDQHRTDYANLHRLSLDLPNGERIPLSAVARVYEAGGPNTINRENVRRRITIRCNPTDRDLGSVVADIRKAVDKKVTLPEGYFIEYGGQFQAQQEATQLISVLSLVSLSGVFLVLYTLFPSVRIVLQIMLALPIAFVGGVLALWLTGQTLTVASLVGFISLGGIAARNGILLVAHYLHLMREEGEAFSYNMVLRGSLERLAPVLMTALTAGIGLVPLVIGGQQPGKEILYPVATVILGGLITSTICEYLVHPGLFWRFSGPAADRLAHRSVAESSSIGT
ncbi:efflux RND transporter permease subunit [Planctomicrobium piriforme]|nr:efflux RND transporter permease subunit [Planctomicrobium piriforme]